MAMDPWGGFIKPKVSTSSYHLTTSPFTRGTSCSQGVDKSNPADCLIAYFQFKEIESRISKDSYTLYTDGSVSNKIAGAGYVIYKNAQLISERAAPLGRFTISFAELEAVRLFLEDLSFKNERPLRKLHKITQEQKEKVEIHIFTDSQFTQNILCSNDTNLTYFYLVEEIKNLAATLADFSFTIHWIPSYIEHT